MDMPVKDEDGITVINHAKVQTTYSDYILAEEEYARKKALAAALKASGGAPTASSPKVSTSSIAARMDRAESIRQLKKLLANPEISQEDRNTMERRLSEEEMAAAFTR